MKLDVKNIADFDLAMERMRNAYIANKVVTVEIKDETRTSQQRKAIEVYCSMMAKGLNDAGLDMQTTLATAASIPWTQASIKENVWRQIQIALFDKKSTTRLFTNEVTKVYEVMNRHMGENHGVSMLFPSYDGREYKDR